MDQNSSTTDALAAALQHSNACVLRAMHQAIITVDERQRVVMINPAALRMFGYTEDEALGSDLARFLPARYRAVHAEQVLAFADSGAQQRAMGKSACLRGLRANGEEFPLAATIVRSQPPDGAAGKLPRLMTALLSDLSAEQALQAELETLRQQFEQLFDAAPIAIIVVEHTRLVLANQASLDLLRASRADDLLGRSILEFLAPDAQTSLAQAIDHALANAGEVGIVQKPLKRLDGSTLSVEIAVAAFKDGARATAQLVLTDVTTHEAAREELLRSGAALRRLSGSIVDAREEERRRLARELHDELGQRLSVLKMALVSLGQELHGRASQQHLLGMLETLDGIVAAMRHIAADLRPLMLDDLGLNAAIEWLARESSRRMGLEVSVELDDSDPPADHRTSTALYRMVQEALTNVGRHAHASRVWIALHRQGDELLLSVRDNGKGFPLHTPSREDAFGLQGMRERAILLGGHMMVDKPPDGGARIRVYLPVPPGFGSPQYDGDEA